MRNGDTEHGETLLTYWVIYVALMVLLALTIIGATVDFAQWRLGSFSLHFLNLTVAMAIAVVKALLVILFFMHVRQSSRIVWFFAGAAFIWLGILLVLTMNDYATRVRTPGAGKPLPLAAPALTEQRNAS